LSASITPEETVFGKYKIARQEKKVKCSGGLAVRFNMIRRTDQQSHEQADAKGSKGA